MQHVKKNLQKSGGSKYIVLPHQFLKGNRSPEHLSLFYERVMIVIPDSLSIEEIEQDLNLLLQFIKLEKSAGNV